MEKKIPILAIVGFLGSGKTSLLNHILQNNQGLKIAVIVNDFGAINIDAMLVAKQTDSQLELSNGCICCAVEDSGLDDAISQLAHAGSLIDYIIIEASGLAEPTDLARILEASKNKYARLDSILAVIDAETVLDMSEKHPSFFKQLGIADTIVLNKIDLASASKQKKVKGYLKFLNERARIIEAEHGQIDTRLILDIDASNKRDGMQGEQLQLGHSHEHGEHRHLHDHFTKTTFSSRKPIDPKAFELYMKEGIDTAVYRAKGFVYFGMKGLEQKYVFQLVGNRFTLKAEDWRGHIPETELVFIGEAFDIEKLQNDLEKLIDTSPDDIAGNLMDIHAYR